MGNSSINIDKDINIYGSDSTILDAQSSSSIFNIKKGVNVNISGVTLVNGYSKSNGGSIVNEGNLYLTNSKIQNSKSDNYGGAIYSTGILNIVNTYFDKNSAFDAGAIFSNNDLTITDSQFLNHKANHKAGVIMIAGDTCSIYNSLFKYNTEADEGGCIFIAYGDVYIENSRFLENRAKSYGAAINNDGTLTVKSCEFSKNRAYGAGAIDNGGILKIFKSNFTDNTATIRNGGAIDTTGKLDISESIFNNNRAKAQGGAIIARGDINVTKSSFIDNTAGEMDAIYFNDVVYIVKDNWWGSDDPDFSKLVNIEIKLPVKLTASNLNFLYKDGKSLIVSVKDNMGNPIKNGAIKVYIVGKNYTIKTNSLGQAKLPINLYPKEYPAIIYYLGNGKYESSSIKVNVLVKKVTPNLIASKKTFKLNSKTKSYSATLKDNKGKAIGNVKISLKINGKTYSIKTNKNGVATFKLLLNKIGNYKLILSFAGNRYYNALSKTLAVYVRK